MSILGHIQVLRTPISKVRCSLLLRRITVSYKQTINKRLAFFFITCVDPWFRFLYEMTRKCTLFGVDWTLERDPNRFQRGKNIIFFKH